MSHSLGPHELYNPGNSPGQNTGVGSLSLRQGVFLTQGSNPGLPHCGQILYQLSHKGSPRIQEWVAYPFSSESFQPRNWTRVSPMVGRFFTNWAIREVLKANLIVGRIIWRCKGKPFMWKTALFFFPAKDQSVPLPFLQGHRTQVPC